VVAAYDPVLLVSSDLTRARETAALLEKETGITAEEDPRLREFDLGERTGLTHHEFVAQQGSDAWDPEALGAESEEILAARVVPALQEALGRLEAGQTAVLVLHGGCLRVAVAGVLGWPLEAAEGLGTLDNCGWAVLAEGIEPGLRLTAYNLTAGGPHPD
jgi:probable phosphoglycerate mutase